MYINKIDIDNFRTFKHAAVDFVHGDQDFNKLGIPRPALPNINLLLGNNGAGKTTMLKAIAIAALGPSVTAAGLPIYRLIRQVDPVREMSPTEAVVEAEFTLHEQDERNTPLNSAIESVARIIKLGDVELPSWMQHKWEVTVNGDTGERSEPGRFSSQWDPIFSNASDAFFFVGYGATRRAETRDHIDPGARSANSLLRAQRIRSLFEEAYSLVPLSVWLPQLESTNPGRYTQAVHLINSLLKDTVYEFTGALEDGEYVFKGPGGLSVPFPAMSDGYRAYLGWIGDLLYHVAATCPSGKKLVDNRGMVMVDEIDLHLHPKWQMKVLPTLSKALPNLQFIVTSHSPLVVGSLEWMNILLMSAGPKGAGKAVRNHQPVHGLDADQVLLTDFFGLSSSRSGGKDKRLRDLSLAASSGDTNAALELVKEMSRGSETAA